MSFRFLKIYFYFLQLALKQEDSQFDMIFTITDVPPVEELGIELPIEATRPLDECYQKIEHSVRSGAFFINVSF